MPFDVHAIRNQFPALRENFGGRPAVFFDNPGGAQLPQRVLDAMHTYLVRSNANSGGLFETSRQSDDKIAQARQAAADLLGAQRDEIVFGANMTSLTYALSRALAREIERDDEIIVTRLDHEANISPWLQLAAVRGAKIQWADVDLETSTLDMAQLRSLFSERTKLVAVGYASNASGSINDLQTIIGWARESGALTFIDAVQYAPHGLIDIQALDCDFLAFSAYKLFGPHVGVLYAKQEHLSRLSPERVRTAATAAPQSWERGTQNHEGIAGLLAAIDYLAEIGVSHGEARLSDSRRAKLVAAWQSIHTYEQSLIDKLISGLQLIADVRIYGITSRYDWEKRVPTFAIRKELLRPRADAASRRRSQRRSAAARSGSLQYIRGDRALFSGDRRCINWRSC